MSKLGKLRVLILSAAAVLFTGFVLFLFLSLPLGGRASLLPVTAFYIAGGISAIGLMTCSLILFFCGLG